MRRTLSVCFTLAISHREICSHRAKPYKSTISVFVSHVFVGSLTTNNKACICSRSLFRPISYYCAAIQTIFLVTVTIILEMIHSIILVASESVPLPSCSAFRGNAIVVDKKREVEELFPTRRQSVERIYFVNSFELRTWCKTVPGTVLEDTSIWTAACAVRCIVRDRKSPRFMIHDTRKVQTCETLDTFVE